VFKKKVLGRTFGPNRFLRSTKSGESMVIKSSGWEFERRRSDRNRGKFSRIRGCIQKFPDWPPRAKTANGTALCHWVQLYRYFVSQSSEFCQHNPSCCFSTNVYCCCLFRYRISPEAFGYTVRNALSFLGKMRHRMQEIFQ